jgi:hypothetical protein
VAGQTGIFLENTVDKEAVLESEGVYFAFPLNVPGGRVHVDIPWGVVRPETDQLPGANRNYFAVQRWIDISNEQHGITWVTPDAPMIKFAPLTLVGKGRGDSGYMSEFHEDGIRPWWHRYISPGQTFFSWVMNNHWEVNYKAFQEGEATFRYWLIPHEGNYDGAKAEKEGRAHCQPLLVLERRSSDRTGQLPFEIHGDRIIATSLTSLPLEHSYLLRLYNPSASGESVSISSLLESGMTMEYCDPSGGPSGLAGTRIELPGYGITTIRISFASSVNRD